MKQEIILPDYNHSILNLITTVLKYYNVDTNHTSLGSLMGEHILNNISPNGFFNKQKIDCITSVYPSTTTAALTTYYSRKTAI